MRHTIKESVSQNPELEILNCVFQCFSSANLVQQPMDCFETLDFDALLDADDLYYASLERCQEVPDVLDTLLSDYPLDLSTTEAQFQDQWTSTDEAMCDALPLDQAQVIPQFDTGSSAFAIAVDLYIQREISGYDWDNITILPDDETLQVYNKLAQATDCPLVPPTSHLRGTGNVKIQDYVQVDQPSFETADSDTKMTVYIGEKPLRIPKMSPNTLSQVFSAKVLLDAEAVKVASSVKTEPTSPSTPPTRNKRKYQRRNSAGHKSSKSASKKAKNSDRSLPLTTPTSSHDLTVVNDENDPPKKRRGRPSKPKSANTSLMDKFLFSTPPTAPGSVSPPLIAVTSGSSTSDSITPPEFTTRTTRAMRRQNRLCKSIG